MKKNYQINQRLIKTIRLDYKRLLSFYKEKESIKCKYLLNPRFITVILYRLSNISYKHNCKLIAQFISLINLILFGCEIPYSLNIGPGLVIPHPNGVVLGAKKIGCNVTILHQVTIGSLFPDFNYKSVTRPEIRNNVLIGAGAKILGPICISDNCVIGANAVVLKNLPANCTAVGIPAKIIKIQCKR